MSSKSTTDDTQNLKFCAPFDDDDADIILRSSDGLNFRVYKVLLAKASPVFKDMLSMPQTHDDVQIVPLTDNGAILEKMLRLIYPIYNAPYESLDDVSNIITICGKYHLDSVAKRVETTLLKYVDTLPLRVYVLACEVRLEAVARKAAWQCLYYPLLRISQTTIEHASFAAYRNILCCYQECGQAVEQVTSDRGKALMEKEKDRDEGQFPLPDTYCWIRDEYGDRGKHTCVVNPEATWYDMINNAYYERQWWGDFLDGVGHVRFDRPVLVKQIPHIRSTGCKKCDKDCINDMDEFIPKLEEKIKLAVSKVSD